MAGSTPIPLPRHGVIVVEIGTQLLAQVRGRGGVPGVEFLLGRRRRRQLRNEVPNGHAPLGRDHGKPITHRAVDLDRGVRHPLSIPPEYLRASRPQRP